MNAKEAERLCVVLGYDLAAWRNAQWEFRLWGSVVEGMTNLGRLVIQGNVPCIRCGHGDDCPMTGIKMLHGPDASVASVGVKVFEEDLALLTVAKESAVKLSEVVLQ
jgi:hypothetical protein